MVFINAMEKAKTFLFSMQVSKNGSFFNTCKDFFAFHHGLNGEKPFFYIFENLLPAKNPTHNKLFRASLIFGINFNYVIMRISRLIHSQKRGQFSLTGFGYLKMLNKRKLIELSGI